MGERQAAPQTETAAPIAKTDRVMMKIAPHYSATAPVHEVLRVPGQPLDATTRAFMEPRFDHDFSRVRVHTDEAAARSAQQIEARAYSFGQHIVFGTSQYRPQAGWGQQLIAHELAHVAQQADRVAVDPLKISSPIDEAEQAADRAAATIWQARKIHVGPGDAIGLHRQFIGATPVAAPTQSQAELIVDSFLNQMWTAQSKQEQPFRITPGVLEGLQLIFPLGVPNLRYTIHPSTSDVLTLLRPHLPATVNPSVVPVLDRLPTKEKPLTNQPKTEGEPAEPKFPTPAPEFKAPPDPRKEPEKGKGEEEAMQEALKAAFEEFRKTKIGKELEESVKSYVFSKEGIPLVIFVVSGVLTFVAANDPKLPSVPEIPLGEGIKLKFEYSGRVSDLPPFLRQLARGESDATSKDEKKVGVSVTLTFEAIEELAKSVGRFFAKAGRWIANGIVKVGTVIGKALAKAAPYLLAALGGAALGAGIGGIAGGGFGALIGAAIGAGVGLLGAIIGKAVSKN
jgi:hypothetical protein